MAVELIDETVREGDARGFHPKSPTERLALVGLIQEICGIREFSIGWAAIARQDRDTLHAFLEKRRRGEIARDSRALVFALFQTEAPLKALVQDIAPSDREGIVIGFATVASDQITPHLDGPWLSAHDGVPARDLEATRQRLSTIAAERIAALRTMGFAKVGMLIQDAFRAPADSTALYVASAVAAGADFVRVNDSVGTATPDLVRERITALVKAHPQTPFIGHFHNDLGLATANALTAVAAGVQALDVTVNGVGNRAGNPSVAEVLVALRTTAGVELPDVRYERLSELARAAERHFCLPLSPYAPITGALLYHDEASIRTHHIEAIGPHTWMPYDPATVGGRAQAIHTPTSGRGTIAQTLSRRGLAASDEILDRAMAWVSAEMARRATEYRPVAQRALDAYAEAIQRSYVSDEDLVAEAAATGGRFDRTSQS